VDLRGSAHVHDSDAGDGSLRVTETRSAEN